MEFIKEKYEEKFKELKKQHLIVESTATFKINLFFKKAEASLLIAINQKLPKKSIGYNGQ